LFAIKCTKFTIKELKKFTFINLLCLPGKNQNEKKEEK